MKSAALISFCVNCISRDYHFGTASVLWQIEPCLSPLSSFLHIHTVYTNRNYQTDKIYPGTHNFMPNLTAKTHYEMTN